MKRSGDVLINDMFRQWSVADRVGDWVMCTNLKMNFEDEEVPAAVEIRSAGEVDVDDVVVGEDVV